MRNIFVILLALVVTPCFAQYGASKISIEREGGRKGLNYGTACLIESDVVITCYHAIDGENWRVRFGNKWYSGEVIAKDEKQELALVRLNEAVRGEKPISIGTASIGEKVWLGGFAGDPDSFKLMPGKLANRGYSPQGAFATKIEGAIARPGDSGGPIVNSRGYLVGIVWAYVDGEMDDNDEKVQWPEEDWYSVGTEIVQFVAQNLQHKRYDAYTDVDPYIYEKHIYNMRLRWFMREQQLEAYIKLNQLPVPAKPEELR